MQLKNSTPVSVKRRDISFDIKTLSEEGFFTGYGSVFDVVDSYGDVVLPGAFTKSLQELQRTGRTIPILWQHYRDSPIGSYSKIYEDNYGLKVEGRLLINDIPQAKEAYVLMREKVISGLSIGYYERDWSFDEKTGVRKLNELDLVEVSVVTFPANDDSRVDQVKQALHSSKVPDLASFKEMLRVSGFTPLQVDVICNKGFMSLGTHTEHQLDINNADLSSLINQISSFKD